MTSAQDTGIYGFLLCASHGTLLLQGTLFGVAKGTLYNTPNCKWCAVNLNTQVHEDLEHCIVACPAHTIP
jgi:hypothetical protein